MKLITVDSVTDIRKRLHCSLRRATNVAKREQMLNKLDDTCDNAKMSDFQELMEDIIYELYKD